MYVEIFVALAILLGEMAVAPFVGMFHELDKEKNPPPPRYEYTVEIPDDFRAKLKVSSGGTLSSGELISEYLDTHTIAGLTTEEWQTVLTRNAALDRMVAETGWDRNCLNGYTKEG